MKTITKNTLVTSIFMILLSFAFSQADVQESNYNKLDNTMTLEQQSTYNLEGFEGRAVQKTKDFAGYLEIISNRNFDLTLRKEAANTAMNLFYNNTAKIENTDLNISNLKIIELEDYADIFLNSKYTKITVDITDCSFKENLKLDKSDSYKGKLEFNQNNRYYKDNSVTATTTEHKEVDIILVKTTKEFGKKTKNVWNVFLGEIRTINK